MSDEPTPSAEQLRTPANYLAYGLRVLSKEYSSLTADTMQSAAKLLLEQERTIAELREWKRQQLEVESGWDAQAVGELIPGLKLGYQIRPAIQPYLEKLKAELAARAKTISELENRITHLVLASEEDDSIADILRTENERLTKWKQEANEVLSEIDMQAVAKLMELPLGAKVLPAIQPFIERLTKERDEAQMPDSPTPTEGEKTL